MLSCITVGGLMKLFKYLLRVSSAPLAASFNCIVVVESLLLAFGLSVGFPSGTWRGGDVVGGWGRLPWCNSNLLLWACRC